MERTDDIKLYLKNKHQGGENNQKGSLFEDFYAVYQIVSYIAKYKSSFDSVEFQTQYIPSVKEYPVFIVGKSR